MMKRIGKVVAVLGHWIKGMIALALCHRAMHGLAMTVYWAQSQGMVDKEVAGYVLFTVYMILFAKD